MLANKFQWLDKESRQMKAPDHSGHQHLDRTVTKVGDIFQGLKFR